MALQDRFGSFETLGDCLLDLGQDSRPSHMVNHIDNLSIRVLHTQLTLNLPVFESAELIVEALIRGNKVTNIDALILTPTTDSDHHRNER